MGLRERPQQMGEHTRHQRKNGSTTETPAGASGTPKTKSKRPPRQGTQGEEGRLRRAGCLELQRYWRCARPGTRRTVERGPGAGVKAQSPTPYARIRQSIFISEN